MPLVDSWKHTTHCQKDSPAICPELAPQRVKPHKMRMAMCGRVCLKIQCLSKASVAQPGLAACSLQENPCSWLDEPLRSMPDGPESAIPAHIASRGHSFWYLTKSDKVQCSNRGSQHGAFLSSHGITDRSGLPEDHVISQAADAQLQSRAYLCCMTAP